MKEWKLWYSRPALGWSQGLPIGNGRLGAVIYGGIDTETWSITELTYWSGKPELTESPGGGKAALERMRRHFFAGDYKQGEALAQETLQSAKGNFGTNLQLCDLLLRFGQQGENFQRELNLNDAIESDSYIFQGKAYRREVLASHADGIVASRLWSEHKGGLSLDYNGDVHFTETNNDFFEFTFKGKGIQLIAEKDASQGDIDIYMDNKFVKTVSAKSAARQAQQIVYSLSNLSGKTHTLKAVKKSGDFMLIDALKVTD